MSLTRNQIHERFRDLSGEIKAAHTAIADCAADCGVKDKMAEIARQALDKAQASLAALYEERARLAQAYAEQALAVGEDRPGETDRDSGDAVYGGFESAESAQVKYDIWGNPAPLIEGANQIIQEWPTHYLGSSPSRGKPEQVVNVWDIVEGVSDRLDRADSGLGGVGGLNG